MKHFSYWTSPEQLEGPDTEVGRQTASSPGDGSALARRDFLKLSGFAMGATMLAGCERGSERDVVPYLVSPEEVVPGRSYEYATVCGACPAACGALARAVDGHPIKMEGNPGHPLSAGGLCALGQASVLELYDSQRLRHPLQGGKKSSWRKVDAALSEAFAQLETGRGSVRFLIDSTTGPAERAAIEQFVARFPDGRLVIYDPISCSSIADAHAQTHGLRRLPRFHFDRAELIVSIAADFLGEWIAPVEFTAGYSRGRSLASHGGSFSRHIHLESRLSLTGSNADQRIVMPAGASAAILAHLAYHLAGHLNLAGPAGRLPELPIDLRTCEGIVRELLQASRGRSLVVCGENDPAAQRLVNFINEALGNYGSTGTLDLRQSAQHRLGVDAELLRLDDELRRGDVDGLLIRGVNPVFELPFGEDWQRAFAQIELVVAFAERRTETASHAHYLCPEPHFLECWGDSEPVEGIVALRQPILRTLGQARPLLESLARWSGRSSSARAELRGFWRRSVFPRCPEAIPFDDFWDRTLHDGWAIVESRTEEGGSFAADTVTFPADLAPLPEGHLRVELFPSAATYDGRHAHNPWLLELPDPITKITWENCAAIAASTAAILGIQTGDEIEILRAGSVRLTLPALVQPGQHAEVIAIALGWGRQGTDRFARVGPQWLEGRPTVEPGSLVGSNGSCLISRGASTLHYAASTVCVRATGRKRGLATTQQHHSLTLPGGLAPFGRQERNIVQELTLGELREHESNGRGHARHHASLYKDHAKAPHHWGMAIDLSLCTGCSACVVACQAENNIPVVGRDEVARSREMHWLRIDRYYRGDAEAVDVVHMPMMCQHCDNAPCENVCPVQATVQSAEGLNQQVYNRCVGTRYCANNCPYKVRRFNWFDYPRADGLRNLVLNPNVTVRSRGVMEKCSLCVQRIQEAKFAARSKGLELTGDMIKPACAQSCPAGAISFGDALDAEGRLAKARESSRHFTVLEELGAKPVVGYLAKVRNRIQRAESHEQV